jgi:hypothetical protein
LNPIRLVGIVLVVAGILGLIYGSFSFTQEKTVVKVGSVELNAKEDKTVDIPMWAGIGAIVVGGLMLVMGGKRA